MRSTARSARRPVPEPGACSGLRPAPRCGGRHSMENLHPDQALAAAGDGTAQGQAATAGRRAVAIVDRVAARAADLAWRELKRAPYFGVAAAAGVTLAAASIVGVPEL